MKQLIRRLSRVADSSQYCILSSSNAPATGLGACLRGRPRTRRSSTVPEGHVPVRVGDEMERFVVNTEMLSHPIFVKLLNQSAQEYGYRQKGALRIPCNVVVFERILEALRVGNDLRELPAVD